LHAILDAGLVAHVAVVDGGQPFVLPVAYSRDGERVLLHGSTGSRLFRALAGGAPMCLTVTLIDGLILARTAFESSMRYRSAMVLGRAATLDGDVAELALQRLTEQLTPGRWEQLRPPSRKELAATTVVSLPLDEWSVKVSAGDPEDAAEDLDWPVWAGVIPIEHRWGQPVPSGDLRGTYPPPRYVGRALGSDEPGG
jgi:nitroimidazol reductase NimA-like FMN-containing flavoprotein (pyridoxamine 5'-phosphate oxidase superfamily)